MSNLLDQYIETALWCTMDDNDEPLEDNYIMDDISKPSLEKCLKDLDQFMEKAKQLVDLSKYEESTIAHDFWLTRNGHGAGFWDGGYEKKDGDLLTQLAKSFGEADLYIGDDGMLHISPLMEPANAR